MEDYPNRQFLGLSIAAKLEIQDPTEFREAVVKAIVLALVTARRSEPRTFILPLPTIHICDFLA